MSDELDDDEEEEEEDVVTELDELLAFESVSDDSSTSGAGEGTAGVAMASDQRAGAFKDRRSFRQEHDGECTIRNPSGAVAGGGDLGRTAEWAASHKCC